MQISDRPAARILLIVCGGIAAFKALELIRRLKDRGDEVQAVMTASADRFVTPLSVAALSGVPVRSELFNLTDEARMGHIELSRAADVLVVAPASANMLAKMAAGLADDLASTLLLATDKPVLVAPAMNVRMWTHPATARNMRTLRQDGIAVVGPNDGAMACGEFGPGRMSEPHEIIAALDAVLTARKPTPVPTGATCRDHRRANARTARSRALHRQPVLGQTGFRDCGGGSRGGRARNFNQWTGGARETRRRRPRSS